LFLCLSDLFLFLPQGQGDAHLRVRDAQGYFEFCFELCFVFCYSIGLSCVGVGFVVKHRELGPSLNMLPFTTGPRTVVAPPSSVVKCFWEVFVWGFGVLFVSCVCVGVGGAVLCRCVCVCVCGLLIFLKSQGKGDARLRVRETEGYFEFYFEFCTPLVGCLGFVVNHQGVEPLFEHPSFHHRATDRRATFERC